MILGVIEDSLDAFENGSPEEKEDAKAELLNNYDEYIKNLSSMDSTDAKGILERLQKIKGQL